MNIYYIFLGIIIITLIIIIIINYTNQTGKNTGKNTNFGAKKSNMVDIKDFGAVCDGITDDTVAIQNALNTGKDVTGSGGCLISSTLFIKGGSLLFQSDFIIYVTRPSANSPYFPIISNEDPISYFNFSIENIKIDFTYTTGYNIPSDPNACGIKFVNIGDLPYYPAFFTINHVYVKYGYCCYYDTSASWMCNLTNVWAFNCYIGIYKYGGTTFHFSNCHGSQCVRNWWIEDVSQSTLTCCGADGVAQNIPLITLPSFDSANYFANCLSLTINGFDMESSYIGYPSCTAINSLLHIEKCVGFNISGYSASLNRFYADAGIQVSCLRFTDYSSGNLNSAVIISGYTNYYEGEGTCITLLVEDGVTLNMNACLIGMLTLPLSNSLVTPVSKKSGSLSQSNGSLSQSINTRGRINTSNCQIDYPISLNRTPASLTPYYNDINYPEIMYVNFNTYDTIYANSSPTIIGNIPISGNTIINLDNSQMTGKKFRIVRNEQSSDNNIITIHDNSSSTNLCNLSNNQWCDVVWDQTYLLFVLTGKGSLS